MTKTNITLVFCIFITSTLSYAMEKDFQIHCIQDIPKLSLKDVRPCFNVLPKKERNKLLIPLAESWTFNMALLEEKKVRLHILTFLLDHDEKSAQLFDATPLWYAHQFYQNLHKKLQHSSAIQHHAGLLFRLPKKTRQQLIKIASTQPTFIAEWVDNSTIFINKRQKKALQCGNEEIKEKFCTDTIMRLFTDQISKEYRWYDSRLFCVLTAITLLPIGLVLNTIRHNSLLHETRMALYNVTNSPDGEKFKVLGQQCHVEYGKLICHEETPIMETIESCAYFYAFSFMIISMFKIYVERNILEECPIIKI